MKIIILGAGQVGASLAAHLASEANDITVVDRSAERLEALQQRYDLRTVLGHSSHPSTLKRAGADSADMLVAVTSSDECNMIACQTAEMLYRTPTKIARIRSQAYLDHPELFCDESIPIDVIISPEQLITESIHRVIKYPGTLQVLDFANGNILFAVVKADHNAQLVGSKIKDIKERLPSAMMSIVAIYRNNIAVNITAQTEIQAGDEVFFLSPYSQVQTITFALRKPEKPYKKIIIAGGGHIGSALAQCLEKEHPIKLIEQDKEKALDIANRLHSTIVLHGSCADKMLLQNENIEDCDIFCALTNDDEANIMASLLAKHMGVKKVMTLVTQSSYVELIEDSQIDIVISPQQTTLSGLLSHVRKGDTVKVHTLRRGAAEAIEIIAHGDQSSSRVVGKMLSKLSLPKGAKIAAIVRNNKVIIAQDDTIIESDDHVILFLPDKAQIPTIEKLFQVGISFF